MKISDIKLLHNFTRDYILSEDDKNWIINRRAESRTPSIFYKSVNARFGIFSTAYDYMKVDDNSALIIIQRKIHERYIEIWEVRNNDEEFNKSIE